MTYRTRIAATGPNTTGILVPEDVLASLGGGKRPAVTVRIGGHTYRSSVATMDGRAMISLSAENRAAAGVAAGDEVDVEVLRDTAPREVDVPADLQAALDAEPDARATWDGLSYSNRRWHVLQIEGAKAAETRRRRIDRSIATLKEGRAR
jgi:hypothetical protein